MTVTVRQIEDNELNLFVNFPYRLYKNSPYWIGDLKSSHKYLLSPKHPFWLHAKRALFIAEKDNMIIGRIAAIWNENHNKYHNEKMGFFGFFDLENNKEAAALLLGEAEKWCKQQGAEAIRGPFNPSTNDTCGMLANNFDKEPMIMMPYNHAYYLELVEGCGYTKAKDLVNLLRRRGIPITDRVNKILARIRKRTPFVQRDVRLDDIENEMQTVRKIYNEAWAQNWGFVPITEQEMSHTVKELKLFLKPYYGSILEIDNVPFAFVLTIPDMNMVLKKFHGSITPFNVIPALNAYRKINRSRLIMMGVMPQYRGHGFEMLLIEQVINLADKVNWDYGELGWILEDNQATIKVSFEFGAELYKRYRIYQKPL